MTCVTRSGFMGLLAVGAVAVLALGAVAASGCGDSQASLTDTSWRLSGWSASSLDPADFTITAAFTDAEVGGTSAVNSYGGPYAAGADGSFSVGALASTQMAGPEPAMRAETIYLELLEQAAEFSLDGGTLTLTDANGNQLLIFAPGE